eukprot:13949866-Ditylum_brightwellii.AAC.1
MMTLPFKYGFTPQHWMISVDVILKKDPGSPKLPSLYHCHSQSQHEHEHEGDLGEEASIACRKTQSLE